MLRWTSRRGCIYLIHYDRYCQQLRREAQARASAFMVEAATVPLEFVDQQPNFTGP